MAIINGVAVITDAISICWLERSSRKVIQCLTFIIIISLFVALLGDNDHHLRHPQ